MKRTILTFTLLKISILLFAQFQENGTSILYTTKRVGIGTSSPLNGNLWISSSFGNALATEHSNHSSFITNGNYYMFMGVDATREAGYIQTILRNTKKTSLLLNPQGGNVGIGITTPKRKLNVAGDILIENTARKSSIHLRTDGNGNAFISNMNGFIGNGSTGNTSMKITGQGGIYLATGNDGSSGTTRMSILTNGQIGIGTSSFSTNFKLAVKGKILAEGVKVSLSPADWSDFVFAESYSLLPLEEVETFIKENKHLPEVPSAEQVGEQGIDLAKMDAVLLQKIEELTLYMIQVQKSNDKLVESNNTLIQKNIELEKRIKELEHKN